MYFKGICLIIFPYLAKTDFKTIKQLIDKSLGLGYTFWNVEWNILFHINSKSCSKRTIVYCHEAALPIFGDGDGADGELLLIVNF